MIQVMDLNHVNITTRDTDRAVKFYAQVLGLKEGPNPALASRLRWMYQGDRPLVHISQAAEGWTGEGETAFQHIAFRITNHDTAKRHIEQLGMEHRVNIVEDFTIRQIFFDDPDGVTVELIEIGGPLA